MRRRPPIRARRSAPAGSRRFAAPGFRCGASGRDRCGAPAAGPGRRDAHRRGARRARAIGAAALLAGALAAPGAAPAQGLHPMPLGPRPLHLRLADADVVAIGTVDAIETGRIAIRDARILRGEAPDRFEVKRSPAAPPPLAPGVSALLLLRGARPPYVLLDEPRELVVLRDDAAIAAWHEAVSRLLAAGGDRARIADVYLAGLDADDERLREVAGAAWIDPRTASLPIAPEQGRERARAALDPARPEMTRRISAIVAARTDAGLRELLRHVPGEAPDAQVVETALRAGVQLRAAETEAALLRSLAADDPRVRRAAIRVTPLVASEAVRATVAELAARDPDESVRREAHDRLAERAARGS